MLPVLILEDNYLYKITVNSAKSVGLITHLCLFTETSRTFVRFCRCKDNVFVKSGVALNIGLKDIPPKETFDNYPIVSAKDMCIQTIRGLPPCIQTSRI